MGNKKKVSRWKDKVLFTPGPLTTSQTVKQAMLRDLGSRDFEFIEMVRAIRHELLNLAGVDAPEYEAVLMQGSGTFGIEAVISSVTPPDGKWLIVVNGAYGRRIEQITAVYNIPTVTLTFPENKWPDPLEVDIALRDDPQISHVAVVHCETTTGIINPIHKIGAIVAKHKRQYFVDAMSSFGAVTFNVTDAQIDYLVSSANKCIEGVPGFSFAIAKRESLLATEGFARTLSLDLLSQWRGLEGNGQFRFTPPTHTLLAFYQALQELDAEGGVYGRSERYLDNFQTLIDGMRELGFTEYLPPEKQGHIITSFYYPIHPAFVFDRFYQLLNEKDIVIYPGKVSNANCFRIGNIGRIFKADVKALLAGVRETLIEMDVYLTDSA